MSNCFIKRRVKRIVDLGLRYSPLGCKINVTGYRITFFAKRKRTGFFLVFGCPEPAFENAAGQFRISLRRNGFAVEHLLLSHIFQGTAVRIIGHGPGDLSPAVLQGQVAVYNRVFIEHSRAVQPGKAVITFSDRFRQLEVHFSQGLKFFLKLLHLSEALALRDSSGGLFFCFFLLWIKRTIAQSEGHSLHLKPIGLQGHVTGYIVIEVPFGFAVIPTFKIPAIKNGTFRQSVRLDRLDFFDFFRTIDNVLSAGIFCFSVRIELNHIEIAGTNGRQEQSIFIFLIGRNQHHVLIQFKMVTDLYFTFFIADVIFILSTKGMSLGFDFFDIEGFMFFTVFFNCTYRPFDCFVVISRLFVFCNAVQNDFQRVGIAFPYGYQLSCSCNRSSNVKFLAIHFPVVKMIAEPYRLAGIFNGFIIFNLLRLKPVILISAVQIESDFIRLQIPDREEMSVRLDFKVSQRNRLAVFRQAPAQEHAARNGRRFVTDRSLMPFDLFGIVISFIGHCKYLVFPCRGKRFVALYGSVQGIFTVRYPARELCAFFGRRGIVGIGGNRSTVLDTFNGYNVFIIRLANDAVRIRSAVIKFNIESADSVYQRDNRITGNDDLINSIIFSFTHLEAQEIIAFQFRNLNFVRSTKILYFLSIRQFNFLICFESDVILVRCKNGVYNYAVFTVTVLIRNLIKSPCIV